MKMKKYHKICIEKKITKYIFSKEMNILKNRSKSPSLATSTDSPKSYDNRRPKKSRKYSAIDHSHKIIIPILNDEHEPFFLHSKRNNSINESHILSTFSNIKKKHFLTMRTKSNSLVKIKSKITIENNISNTTIIDPDIYDNFLHSISASSSNSNSSNNIKKSKKNKNNEHYYFYDLNAINNLPEKQKVIILSLINLNKDNIYKKEEEIDFLNLDLEEYYFNENQDKSVISPNSQEDYLKLEKKIYQFIDNRIETYYKYCKKSFAFGEIKEEKKREKEIFNNEVKDIVKNIKKFYVKNKSFYVIGFKSIVISLFSFINDLLSNITILNTRRSNKHITKNIIIFIDLIAKYNKVKKIFPYIENDFSEFIELFEKEKNMKISLTDLFTDFYWDHVFKINNIKHLFINAYLSNENKKNISFMESMNSMNKIIDILLSVDAPYKKNIGTILNLPYMERENVFLMDYILKYKKNMNVSAINNIFIEKDKDNEEIKINNNEKEDKENKNDKEDKDNNETNTENFSLEEVYNYIQNNNDEQKGKKKNRRHKRKKKNEEKLKENKNNLNIQKSIDNNENENYYNDPVVDEFIQYFNDYNKINLNCIKIKPIISKEWIESIS